MPENFLNSLFRTLFFLPLGEASFGISGEPVSHSFLPRGQNGRIFFFRRAVSREAGKGFFLNFKTFSHLRFALGWIPLPRKASLGVWGRGASFQGLPYSLGVLICCYLHPTSVIGNAAPCALGYKLNSGSFKAYIALTFLILVQELRDYMHTIEAISQMLSSEFLLKKIHFKSNRPIFFSLWLREKFVKSIPSTPRVWESSPF